MTDYVAYHNPKTMGYPASDVEEFKVLTSKPVKGAIGHRVWLLSREETRRPSFQLVFQFIAERIEPVDDPRFKWKITGSTGQKFRPMPRLNQEEWGSELMHETGHFGLGFQPITGERIIQGLEKMAKSAMSAPSAT